MRSILKMPIALLRKLAMWRRAPGPCSSAVYINDVTTQFHRLALDCSDMGAVRQLYTSFLVMLAAAAETELAAQVQSCEPRTRF